MLPFALKGGLCKATLILLEVLCWLSAWEGPEAGGTLACRDSSPLPVFRPIRGFCKMLLSPWALTFMPEERRGFKPAGWLIFQSSLWSLSVPSC